MAPTQTGKTTKSKKKYPCRCGCGQNVLYRTERNHLQGKAGPLVKAHHAARRLSVLGLSPGHAKQYKLRSPLLSPRKRHPKQAQTSHGDSDHGMDLDSGDDGEQGPAPDDTLPVYFPDVDNREPEPTQSSSMAADSPNSPHPGARAVSDELYDADAAAALRQATAAVREGVWSNGHRVLVEEEPEDDLDDDPDMDANSSEEGEEDFGDDEEQYDEYEWLYGLPAGDIIDEDMERELAEFAEELSEDDLAILRAFALKTEDNLTNATFDKLPYAFPDAYIPTLKVTKARVEFLAAFKPVPYDCCPNSCCCYVGPHAAENTCPYCQEPRYKSNGKPRKTFTYVPLIPRLVAYFQNAEVVEQMGYRGNYTRDKDGTMKDVFDGTNYSILQERFVTVNGTKMPYKFFSDLRDIALGLSTDGFSPFKRRKKTCWPLLVFNYNLPPEIRFHLKHVLCIGVIPGPKKPHDADSFLWPLVEELLKLALGVSAFDVCQSEKFALRAYLTTVFGDIPAVSMLMRMKGHNGVSPCRMCNIDGLRVPHGGGTTHYVPLDRSRHPDVANSDRVKRYDPLDLPMRAHDELLEQAREVQFADTSAAENRLSKKYGIKGIPILSTLPSMFFPLSFPYDFMHLIYENAIKNLILLWTGTYKNLDQGTGEYQLNPSVWDAIGAATAAGGSTIPTAFGARPPDVSKDRTACTADTWSFWLLYLGPILLHNKFLRRVYYDHFIKFVKLIHLCLQFEYTKADIATIRTGFAQWVQEYEKLYYQYSPDRLSACPLTIHALLHIADGIEAAGPVWAYWAFPMERFCGRLQPCINSRRFPFASIDGYVVATAQLGIIKVKNGIDLRLGPAKLDLAKGSFSHPSYPTCVLLAPHKISDSTSLEPGLARKITVCLSTRYDQKMATIRKYFKPENVVQWAKVQRLDGGDRMLASSMIHAEPEDRRDATYVRYVLLVDVNARRPRIAARYEPQTFYGQLQNIFVVTLPPADELELEEETTLILAAVKKCDISARNDLDMHYYRKEGPVEVVDISSIQCLVGRIKTTDGKNWVIIDRSGNLARPYYDPDD